jgi:uridylate kinase
VTAGEAKYGRVLLKLSGESFKGKRDYGIDPAAVEFMAREIKSIHDLGVQVGVVVGGGNIWRGVEAEGEGMDRATADYAGMLATVINALSLQDALERVCNVDTRTMTAIRIDPVAEPYIRRRAIHHLQKRLIVIFAAGIGSPYVTTDTAAALRAIEVDARVVLMAKHNVDGVYAADPNLEPDASKLEFLTYRDVMDRRLAVMDITALSLCMENSVPIVVFNVFEPGSIRRIAMGERLGSLVAQTRAG